MTSRDFCYWLQGYFESHGPGPLTEAQSASVQRHLALVFQHEIDPSFGDAAHQAKLNETHGPAEAPAPIEVPIPPGMAHAPPGVYMPPGVRLLC